ncbi:MAG: CDP-alcohol phosphatidyltransferase family protein [Deinococcales bacterium]
MIDRYLRSAKDKVLCFTAKALQKIHPNYLSLSALAIGLMGACALALGHYGLGLALWLFNRYIDGLDGAVARISQQQSDQGGYLDIICDFAIYALLPIALTISLPTPSNLWALVALLSSFYINAASWMYLAALLEKRAVKHSLTSIIMPAGLIEGAETILFFSLFMLFPEHLYQLFSLMATLVIITVIQRLWWVFRRLSREL